VKPPNANFIASNSQQLLNSSSSRECPIVNETPDTFSSAISSVTSPLAPQIALFKFSYKNNGKEISFELPI
jgi:hypothetical protein